MSNPLPFDLLEDPEVLSQFQCWDREVYQDFLACQAGEMTGEEFKAKYITTAAIFIVDMTGFTKTAMDKGELEAFLRIFDVQKVSATALQKHNPINIRFFADDLTATYPEPNAALDAAFELHLRIDLFNHSDLAGGNPTECCIGLGFGKVYRIGPDKAMGDEMNRASKLGEDTAEGKETLITELFYQEVKDRPDCRFESRKNDELPFPYYAVHRKI